jgi:hypothetical protein
MIKNHSFYFVILFVSLVLTGCGKRCEEFNNDILNWMPYKAGDEIVFQKNRTPDTCYLAYNEIIHTDKIGAWEKCECEDSYSVRISSDSLDIEVMFYHSVDVSDSYVSVNNEGLSFVKQASSYSFNSTSYSNVLIYENNIVSDNKRFEKVLISKSIGIIGIIGTFEEWTIIDDSIKSIQITDVKQSIIDC